MKQSKKLPLPPYTLGTWLFGGDMQRNPDNDDQADIDAIKMHIDMGVNHIFTAQNYADGYAEQLVGSAVAAYDRESLVINTAIKKQDSSYDDMLRSIEESLDRLNLEYVDIVVHHAPLPDVPIRESIKALNEIVDRGLAKGLAVSNYNTNSMQQAVAATHHPIQFNQVCYNLLVREVEQDGVLTFCQNHDITIQAFRPLAHGELVTATHDLIQELGQKYSLSPAQLALAWLTSQEGVVVVATTHTKSHLEDNLDAVSTKLDAGDVERLRTEFPYKTEDIKWIR